MARGNESKTAHAEAMIDVAMIRLMAAARLAGEEIEPDGQSIPKPPDASPKTQRQEVVSRLPHMLSAQR